MKFAISLLLLLGSLVTVAENRDCDTYSTVYYETCDPDSTWIDTLVNSSGCDSFVTNINTYIGADDPIWVYWIPDPVSDPLTIQMIQYSDTVDLYSWDWGDGTSEIAYEPSHTYAEPGIYLLEVCDLSESCGAVCFAYSVIDLSVSGIIYHNPIHVPDNREYIIFDYLGRQLRNGRSPIDRHSFVYGLEYIMLVD